MRFLPGSVIWVLVVVTAACTSERHDSITQEELIRNTQEMFDSVAAGDQAPWKKYFAEDSMYFDEKGRSMDKAALVKDITPLPKGYLGRIKLARAKSRIEGDTAILHMYDGAVVAAELPAAVELTVSVTEPGVQGDRVSGARKPATLETGLVVQVPLFVEPGEKIKVDTRTGEYLARA